MPEHIRREHFDKPADLIAAISPRSANFIKAELNEWVFRGLALDNFALQPSSLRETEALKLHRFADTPQYVRDRMETAIAQEYAEALLLWHFQNELDRQGISLPISPHVLNEALSAVMQAWRTLETQQRASLMPWMKEDVFPLVALAQHYGLPTRMMDWSWSSYVAAYFAADPTRLGQEDGNAHVWALNIRGFMGLGLVCDHNEHPIRVITVPRATNPNLHAQHGVFSLQSPHVIECHKPIVRSPLDHVIEKYDLKQFAGHDHRFMYHFTFPRTTAAEMLWLLAKEGVTAASLFPGHAGVAQAIKERVGWRKPQ